MTTVDVTVPCSGPKIHLIQNLGSDESLFKISYTVIVHMFTYLLRFVVKI